MIRIFIFLLLIILIFVLVKTNIIKIPQFNNQPKTVESLTAPTEAQPNNVNKNTEKLQRIYSSINPANFYTQNYNTPNFTTNVEDLRKYYVYDLPATSPDKNLPLPIDPSFTQDKYPPSNQMLEQAKRDEVPWEIPSKKTASGLEYESHYWVYKNEMPMNGGTFGPIVGYENMGDSFSLFYAKDVPDIVQEQEHTLQRSDDLRNGMGTPQKQKYLYNMSNP